MGAVTDSGGACVVGATVTVLNQNTNASIGIKTGHAGDYEVPNLESGSYTVVVSKDGFQTFRKNDVRVGSAQKVRVNAVLTPAKVTRAGQRGNAPPAR